MVGCLEWLWEGLLAPTSGDTLCAVLPLQGVPFFSQRTSQGQTGLGQAELGRRAEYGPVESWTEEMLSSNLVVDHG